MSFVSSSPSSTHQAPPIVVSRVSSLSSVAPLEIGLVNNMPDAALLATELQVRDLLARAAGGASVSLRLFSLSEVPRGEAGLAHARKYHEPISALRDGNIAGLIVTGAEPKAATITGEPYWDALAQLIDWAADHTISTIFSCLASHAAAYRLDRLERCPLDKKLSGVFAFERAAEHPLIAGRRRWLTPHSRQNELVVADLLAAGYQVLASSPEAGADMFAKCCGSLFVFLQGHPEYDAAALFGEYRRDVRRFLHSERDTYPEIPHGYFTEAAREALLEFRARAVNDRGGTKLHDFPSATVHAELSAPWRDDATALYTNWLDYLAEGRLRRGWRAAQIVANAPRSARPDFGMSIPIAGLEEPAALAGSGPSPSAP